MAAHLYPGVKSLHLVLDKPYDAIRVTDVRDDLESVKVWYSTTSGFNPNNGEGTLVPSGNSLSVTITNLTPNTRYYVKYAFISAIDSDEQDPAGPTGPGSYTVSPQLSEVVYDENVTVYGYLTNDPTGIATASDGTGGNFSLATGIFKVYKLSIDKTGQGPVYSIKPNSTFYLTGATIDATTGVYSCTGMTQNSGSVTFLATYENIIVEQVWNVYRGVAGEKAPLVKLSATNSDFIFKDQYATIPETTNTEITATLSNLPNGQVVFTTQAFKRDGTRLGTQPYPAAQVAFTQTDNKILITGAQFGALGVDVGTVIVTATVGTVFDSFTLYRINDGTEQITVELSNSAHPIPAANNGDTVAANYIGSGTTIKVKEGVKYLNVDPSSPYDTKGTWNISDITSVGITCDTTPAVGSNFISFDTHAAMTADQAYIDYTIAYRTTSGVVGTQTVRQSFAKSKEGVIGSSAKLVNITASRQSFLLLKNTTTATPDTLVLTATASNFTSPQYTWLVDGVAPSAATGTASGNTFTLNKFTDVRFKTIKVTVSEGSFTAFDTFTVYSLREGDDSIAVGLSNENQTIACDSTGTPIAGQFPITSDFYVVQGINLLDGSTTPQVTFAPVSYTGGNSSSYSINSAGTITINSINQQFATAEFSATVSGNTYYKTLTLNKSIDGASAPIVNLSSTGQVFAIAKNTGTVSPETITFTANTFNLGNTPQYSWSVSTDNGSTFSTIAGQTGSTYALAKFSGGTKIVKVTVTGNGKTVYDQITVYSLKEGDDSLAAGLINENQTISCDSSGTPIGGQFPISSQLVVIRGTVVLTNADGVTWSKVSETAMTSTIISTTGIISVTAISAVSASATYRATIGTTTIDKVFTLNKSNAGTPGTPGAPGAPGTPGGKGDPGDPGSNGAQGIVARIAYQLVSQLSGVPAYATVTYGASALPTSGASVWTSTAPTATVGNVVWYSYGRYNPNSFTHEGIQAGYTEWSTPIAASVFQDIKSDNWTGGTPSTTDDFSPGYYLKKTTGTIWATNIFLNGNVIAKGTTTGITGTSFINGQNYTIIPSIAGNGLGENASTSGALRAGIFGVGGSATNSAYNVGVIGVGGDTNKGIGVIGNGTLVGVYAYSSVNANPAFIGRSFDGNGFAGRFDGYINVAGYISATGNITSDSNISALGNITAYSASDKRLKTNITRITNPLEKLRLLGGYSYDWTPDYLAKFTREIKQGLVKPHDVGVIAQEVLAQLPEAVNTRKDGTLAVNYEKLVPLLIEAILELDRRLK